MSYTFYSLVSIGLLALMFFWGLVERQFTSRARVIISIGIVVLSLVIMSFRGFGLDYSNYKEFYSLVDGSLVSLTWFSEEIEPGYYLFMYLFKNLGFNFEFFYFIFNSLALVLLFVSYGVRRFSGRLVFLVFALYYLGYMDVTRSFFASAVLASVVFMISRKDILKAIVFSFVGIFIHYSFLVGLAFLPLSNYRFTASRYFFVMLASLVFGVVSRQLLNIDVRGREDIPLFIRSGVSYFNDIGSVPSEGFLNYTHVVLWGFVIGFVFVFSVVVNISVAAAGGLPRNSLGARFHSLSCWGSSLFLFFLSAGAGILGNRLFLLLSIGLPLLAYIYCFEMKEAVENGSKKYIYSLYSVFLVFCLFFVFLYIAGAHRDGHTFYLGI